MHLARRYLVIGLSLLLVIGLTGLATSSANAVKKEAAATHLRDQSKVTQALARLYLSHHESVLQYFAQSLRTGAPLDVATLDEYSNHPDSLGAAVVAADGEVLVQARKIQALPPLSDPAWGSLPATVATGKVGYSGAMNIGGQAGVATGMPLPPIDGRPAFFVLLVKSIDSAWLESVAAGESGSYVIVDSQGAVVATEAKETGPALSAVLPLLGRARATGAEVDLGGVQTLAVAASIGNTGWSMVYTEPSSSFFGTLRNRNRLQRTAMALGLGVAVLALLFLGFQRERALRRTESLLTAMLGNAADIVVLLRDNRIAFAGAAAEQLLGKRHRALLGRPASMLVSDAERPTLDQMIERAAGQPGEPVHGDVRLAGAGERWAEVTAVDLCEDHGVDGVILTFHDVTERRLLHEQLSFQASHDALTGLPNRTLFNARLEQSLARARRHGRPLAVLFLDLDDFKPVNDRLGHEAGDELLQAVSKRLLASVRAEDTVARFGGDEFAVIVEDVTGEPAARIAGRRLVQAIEAPFDIAGQTVSVGVSVGVAFATPSEESTESLLREADLAMYRAKRRGRSEIEVTLVA